MISRFGTVSVFSPTLISVLLLIGLLPFIAHGNLPSRASSYLR
jgi:hypothetical protein